MNIDQAVTNISAVKHLPSEHFEREVTYVLRLLLAELMDNLSLEQGLVMSGTELMQHYYPYKSYDRD